VLEQDRHVLVLLLVHAPQRRVVLGSALLDSVTVVAPHGGLLVVQVGLQLVLLVRQVLRGRGTDDDLVQVAALLLDDGDLGGAALCGGLDEGRVGAGLGLDREQVLGQNALALAGEQRQAVQLAFGFDARLAAEQAAELLVHA